MKRLTAGLLAIYMITAAPIAASAETTIAEEIIELKEMVSELQERVTYLEEQLGIETTEFESETEYDTNASYSAVGLCNYYFTAIAEQKVDSLWSFIAPEIRDYAETVEYPECSTEDYIMDCMEDSSWMMSLFEGELIYDPQTALNDPGTGFMSEEDLTYAQNYFDRSGVDITLQRAASIDVALTDAENGEKRNVSIFVIGTDRGFFLTSIDGNDTILDI